MLVKYLHSPDLMVSRLAASCLEVFPQTEVRHAVVETLVKDGPSEELAQFATMNTGWTLEDENRIIHAAIPYLLSLSAIQPVGRIPAEARPTQSAAALRLLRYILYVPNHAWPENYELKFYADAQVVNVAAKIMAEGNSVTVQELALNLGAMASSPRVDEMLMQISQRQDIAGQQARGALKWHLQADPKKQTAR
jgi:hypothetical protein